MFPQGAQLLLTAGITGDILGAGEVEDQQREAGRQQSGSQGSREHHGGPLWVPAPSGRQAGEDLQGKRSVSPRAPSARPTSPTFLVDVSGPTGLVFVCLNKFMLLRVYSALEIQSYRS